MASEAGFVLVPTLLTLAFICLACAALTGSVRSHLAEAAAETAAAEAAALSEAGFHLAVADLVNAQWVRGWRRRHPPTGEPRACRLETGRIVVSVTDEAGRIDLNGAGVELLRVLLAGLGEMPEDAGRLADAIGDWRDGDDTPRDRGAEREDYQRAGRPGPANAPFAAIEEVAQVLGMPESTFARLQRVATVHSGLDGVDRSLASPGLLAVLAAGADAVGAREQPAQMHRPSPRRVYRIRAQARGERGGRHVREAVVRVTAGRGQPYVVLAWQRGDPLAEDAAVDLGEC